MMTRVLCVILFAAAAIQVKNGDYTIYAWIVRHGQRADATEMYGTPGWNTYLNEYNAGQRYVGDGQLTPLGHAQGHFAGEAFKTVFGEKPVEFDRIFVSPLERALYTAEPIAEKLKVKMVPTKALAVSDQVMIDMGYDISAETPFDKDDGMHYTRGKYIKHNDVEYLDVLNDQDLEKKYWTVDSYKKHNWRVDNAGQTFLEEINRLSTYQNIEIDGVRHVVLVSHRESVKIILRALGKPVQKPDYAGITGVKIPVRGGKVQMKQVELVLDSTTPWESNVITLSNASVLKSSKSRPEWSHLEPEFKYYAYKTQQQQSVLTVENTDKKCKNGKVEKLILNENGVHEFRAAKDAAKADSQSTPQSTGMLNFNFGSFFCKQKKAPSSEMEMSLEDHIDLSQMGLMKAQPTQSKSIQQTKKQEAQQQMMTKEDFNLNQMSNNAVMNALAGADKALQSMSGVTASTGAESPMGMESMTSEQSMDQSMEQQSKAK